MGHVARLALKTAAPMDAESWVRRSISSGGQYFADGAEVRLYGSSRSSRRFAGRRACYATTSRSVIGRP
ncbi:MAG: hypothetical protein M3N18_04130 [Actinomycetota bacterium]|nr:hypothetical protein [Actinomycetota bacterium]